MRGQELEDGVSCVGGQCLEHPDEHKWWGKLYPSPLDWQRGEGGGIGLCPWCLCPEEELSG